MLIKITNITMILDGKIKQDKGTCRRSVPIFCTLHISTSYSSTYNNKWLNIDNEMELKMHIGYKT